MKRLVLFLILCLAVPVQATEYTWDHDDSLEQTLGSDYNYDTITITGTLNASGWAVKFANAGNILLRGSPSGGTLNDTIFYGTAGGDMVLNPHQGGIWMSDIGCSALVIRDFVLIHDPGNNGQNADPSADPDSIHTAKYNSGIMFESIAGISIINMRIIVYGEECIPIQNYNGTGAHNVYIDSTHLWNMTWAYATRADYGGAGIRLELRPVYSGDMFSAHIYRTVVWQSSHAGITTTGNITNRAKGTEIAYCTTYVDARNDTLRQSGQSYNWANAYGILTAYSVAPFDVHDNVILSGTKYQGSRGIIIENAQGTVTDSIKVRNNHVETSMGPDGEAGNSAGVNRVLRIRNLDGGRLDFLSITGNTFIAFTDSNTSTTHIGANASVAQFGTYSNNPDSGRFLFEDNTITYRSLSRAGTDGSAVELAIEVSGLAPWQLGHGTFRNNTIRSSDRIFLFGDDFNNDGCHKLEIFGDTIGFLDTLGGDSGHILTDRSVFRVGPFPFGTGENSDSIFVVNAWFDTLSGARDTNIDLQSSNSNWLENVQHIPVNVYWRDSIAVDSCIIQVNDGDGALAYQDTLGTYTDSVSMRYWRTSGTGSGTDTSYNDYSFRVLAYGGRWDSPDSTFDTLTIDWTVGEVNLYMPLGHSNHFYVSTTGVRNDSGTITNPWTADKPCSASVISVGDTIKFRGGTYNANHFDSTYFSPGAGADFLMQLQLSGVADSPIVYMSYPGERAVFEGDTANPNADGDYISGFDIPVADYITIRDITVRQCNRTGIGTAGSSNSDYITIVNCSLYNVGTGSFGTNENQGCITNRHGTSTAQRWIIDSNVIFTSPAGIQTYPAVGWRISYNEIYDCGLNIFIKTSNATVSDDTIMYNTLYESASPDYGVAEHFALQCDATWRNIFFHHNVMYGGSPSGWFVRTNFRCIVDGMDASEVYVYNNTFDMTSSAAGIAGIINVRGSDGSINTVDSHYFFNNIFFLPQDEVCIKNLNDDNTTGGEGVDQFGELWYQDYNAYVLRNATHEIDNWYTSGAVSHLWIVSETHDSLTGLDATYQGDQNSYTSTDTTSLFADRGSQDYSLNASYSNYVTLSTGGRGSSWPVYMGAIDPSGAEAPASDACPTVAAILPNDNDTLEQTTDTVEVNVADDASPSANLVVQILGDFVNPPTTIKITDTITQDSTGYEYVWSSLVEDSTYYWFARVIDTSNCTTATSVRTFLVDSIPNGAVNVITGVQIGQVDVPDTILERFWAWVKD